MDAFYASVEQRDFPEYRGKPLVVGGKGPRGVISAASYEARKYGVFSAMSSKVALRKCPFLIFANHRFEVYKQVSNQIREIFFQFTDLVEPLSFDEAFLDVTENKFKLNSASVIAKEIKRRIKKETELTASAGVSYNKFLAKIASDYKKPDGFFIIEPKDADEFIDTLPIDKFFGVGKVTAKKMNQMSIYNGSDLKKLSKSYLTRYFGKAGLYYYDIVRGIDYREVNPNRIRKSIGAEQTFEHDLTDINEITENLKSIADELFRRIDSSKQHGRTLTLKVKFADFNQITRSKTLFYYITTKTQLYNTALDLLEIAKLQFSQIRLLGLTVSNLYNENKEIAIQLSLDL